MLHREPAGSRPRIIAHGTRSPTASQPQRRLDTTARLQSHDLGMQLAPVNPVRTAWMASSRANTGRKLFCLVLSFSGRHEHNLVKVEHVVANR